MIPTQATVDFINSLYANNTTVWGAAANTAMIRLVQAEFVPSAALVTGDLTFATFDGSDAIEIPFGAQTVIRDSVTGRVGILLKEPLGGFHWLCGDTVNLPQTIYGYTVQNIATGNLLWSGLLPESRVISGVGDFVEITSLLGYLLINPYDSELTPP